MTHKPKAAITGVFGYLPPDILTNADLEKMVDTSQDWILSRTGIRERHILKGENQGSSVMGIKAVEGLLAKTGLKATDIDVILCATTTPDMVFPATANIIASEIGAINSFGYDVSAACSGFLFTLSTAAQFIESGRYKNIVVVGTDKMSSIVDYQDRSTCILFGDGAGAVLLQPSTNEYGIEDFMLRTDGRGQEYLNMKAGGSRRPASHQTVDDKQHYIYQEGSIVFKFAVTNMADIAAQIMEKNHLTGSDIAWLVPHQANRRIIDATANRMGLDHNRVMLNIDRYGNTTNASMPLCLWEYENQLKKGDKLILAAFGGGFTWGSMYVTWAI